MIDDVTFTVNRYAIFKVFKFLIDSQVPDIRIQKHGDAGGFVISIPADFHDVAVEAFRIEP